MDLLPISDDVMRARLALAEPYTLVVLRTGPRYRDPDSRAIIREHARRNLALVEQGSLAIVCPVGDDTEVCGVGIFITSTADTAGIMDGDPAVRAEVLIYEVHPVLGFPGATLPGR